MSSRFIQNPDGKMAGSVGFGRDEIPTPPQHTIVTRPGGDLGADLGAVHAALMNVPPNVCIVNECTVTPHKYRVLCARHYRSQALYLDNVSMERLDALFYAYDNHPDDEVVRYVMQTILRMSMQPFSRQHLQWLATRNGPDGEPLLVYVDLWHRGPYVHELLNTHLSPQVIHRALDELETKCANGETPWCDIWEGLPSAARVTSDHGVLDRFLDLYTKDITTPYVRNFVRDLAQNPHLTADHMNTILDSPHWDMAPQLAANPAATKEIQQRILSKAQQVNEKEPRHYAEWMQSGNTVSGLLQNPNLAPEVFAPIWELTKRPHIVLELLDHPHVPSEVLDDIVNYASADTFPEHHQRIVHRAAAHPNSTPAVRGKAAFTPQPPRVKTSPLSETIHKIRVYERLDNKTECDIAVQLLHDVWHGTFDELLDTARLLSQ